MRIIIKNNKIKNKEKVLKIKNLYHLRYDNKF